MVLSPLLLLLPAAVAAPPIAIDLIKHTEGCMFGRHDALLLLLLLLLLPTRCVPLGLPCTAQTRYHASQAV
jgi:hypothetical protein